METRLGSGRLDEQMGAQRVEDCPRPASEPHGHLETYIGLAETLSRLTGQERDSDTCARTRRRVREREGGRAGKGRG